MDQVASCTRLVLTRIARLSDKASHPSGTAEPLALLPLFICHADRSRAHDLTCGADGLAASLAGFGCLFHVRSIAQNVSAKVLAFVSAKRYSEAIDNAITKGKL